MTLQVNAERVFAKVAQACQAVQRDEASVNVLAVTKYVDSLIAKELVATGIQHIAENRVDQFLDKYQALKNENLTWHLIGTLQRRKVKDVINLVDYFHALDSVKLAQEISKRAEHPIKCFLQVNISEETSKHGLRLEEVDDALAEMANLPNLELVGIMTMAPLVASRQEISEIFAKAKSLQLRLASRGLAHQPFTELSMGMSGDYDLAIANGATFIRIGSAFFK